LAILQTTGTAMVTLTPTVLSTGTVAFDHNWHRFGVNLQQTTVTVSLDGVPRIAANVDTARLPRSTGEYFHVTERFGYNSYVGAASTRDSTTSE